MIPIEEIAAMSESEYIGYIFRKTKAKNMSVPDFQVGNRVVSSEMYYFDSSPPEKIIGRIVELSVNADIYSNSNCLPVNILVFNINIKSMNLSDTFQVIYL